MRRTLSTRNRHGSTDPRSHSTREPRHATREQAPDPHELPRRARAPGPGAEQRRQSPPPDSITATFRNGDREVSITASRRLAAAIGESSRHHPPEEIRADLIVNHRHSEETADALVRGFAGFSLEDEDPTAGRPHSPLQEADEAAESPGPSPEPLLQPSFEALEADLKRLEDYGASARDIRQTLEDKWGLTGDLLEGFAAQSHERRLAIEAAPRASFDWNASDPARLGIREKTQERLQRKAAQSPEALRDHVDDFLMDFDKPTRDQIVERYARLAAGERPA